jgi:hypothetical protein
MKFTIQDSAQCQFPGYFSPPAQLQSKAHEPGFAHGF